MVLPRAKKSTSLTVKSVSDKYNAQIHIFHTEFHLAMARFHECAHNNGREKHRTVRCWSIGTTLTFGVCCWWLQCLIYAPNSWDENHHCANAFVFSIIKYDNFKIIILQHFYFIQSEYTSGAFFNQKITINRIEIQNLFTIRMHIRLNSCFRVNDV